MPSIDGLSNGDVRTRSQYPSFRAVPQRLVCTPTTWFMLYASLSIAMLVSTTWHVVVGNIHASQEPGGTLHLYTIWLEAWNTLGLCAVTWLSNWRGFRQLDRMSFERHGPRI
jgi:hypothetical protein